jgi:NADH-quinone oxidoreductase subunit H
MKIIYSIILLLFFFISCSYSVLLERKLSSWIQRRVGPNQISIPINYKKLKTHKILKFFNISIIKKFGLLQPIIDGLKLLLKEFFISKHVKKFCFFISPLLSFIPIFITISIIPFGEYPVSFFGRTKFFTLVLSDFNLGMIFFSSVISISIYGIIIGGWSSNNKFSFMGSIRSSSQLISYEIPMIISLIPIFISQNQPNISIINLSLKSIVELQKNVWDWNLFLYPLSCFIFLISLFAENNRLPFDVAESETDLVGGFHTEYGSLKFGIFFLSEYCHLIINSLLFSILFLGGWNLIPITLFLSKKVFLYGIVKVFTLLIKTFLVISFFIIIRWTIPRFKYNQTVSIGWNLLLPISLLNLIFYFLIFLITEIS